VPGDPGVSIAFISLAPHKANEVSSRPINIVAQRRSVCGNHTAADENTSHGQFSRRPSLPMTPIACATTKFGSDTRVPANVSDSALYSCHYAEKPSLVQRDIVSP
jgi:hypothetical protein